MIRAGMMIAAAGAVAGCAAKGEAGGPAVDRSFDVGAFDRIAVAGPYEVEVRTGADPSVKANGPEKQVERMEIVVEDGTLMIRPRKRSGLSLGWSKSEPVQVAVTVPGLKAAKIAGSGDINIDRLSGERFEGAVAGSGDLRIGEINVGSLKMGIAGSGDIRAESGKVGEADYRIAGSGNLNVGSLSANTAAVSIAGSGNISANATETASVKIAGSGNVRLKGGAKCTVSKSGSGNIDCS